MLDNRRINISNVKTKVVDLKGGLNEQVTNLQLKAGELIDCKNYIDQDDVYSGYKSMPGYERYDGRTAPSGTGLDTATFGSEVDTTREANRALIMPIGDTTAVNDTCYGEASGVHIYEDNVYAWRTDNASDENTPTEGNNERMFVDSASGWSEIDTSGVTLTKNGTVRAVNGRFSEYNTNLPIMAWVDGVSQPCFYNGTIITQLDMTSIVGASVFPTHIGIWRNRLFLVYPKGHILFSEVGDPTAWDSATGLAGEIYIGDTVKDFKEAPGGVLMIFTKSKIKALYYGTTDTDFTFKLDDFSSSSGALSDTVQNMLGTLYYSDNRGFSSLEQTAEYGDFSAKNIGRNVQKTFDTNRNNMGVSVVDRTTNRFYQFYDDDVTSNSSGLVFTFLGKRVKGATKISLEHSVVCATEDDYSDGTNKIFFGTSDGYVMQLLKGTSFDGTAISATFTTSYNHFGSPRNWKKFRRLQFEITSVNQLSFSVSSAYNYKEGIVPQGSVESPTLEGQGGVWGVGEWGSFIYGGRILDIESLQYTGHGTNMAVTVSTSSKYAQSHTVHNYITDYTIEGLQQ